VLVKRDDWRLQASVGRNHSKIDFATPAQMAEKDTGKIEIQYDPEANPALDDEIMAVINAHPNPNWSVVKTFTGTVEFMKPGLNKGVGLRRYAERNNIPIGQIMAVGDMDNDVAMIREAGWGVCMANGCDDAKAVADVVTEYGVAEDGFGRYLERHVLPLL
jgi:hydroxymethylpyrimidine pyrophosphatase-like HAD family hydrolase